MTESHFSPNKLGCPVFSWKIRDCFFCFSPQQGMLWMFMTDTWHIHLFLPASYYALYIPGRYVTDSSISPHNLVRPECSCQVRDRFTYLPQKLVCPVYSWQTMTHSPISPPNFVCPVYSCQISDRFTHFSPQLSMPSIFLADTWQNRLFLPQNLVCPVYAWHVRDRFIYLPQQFSMPCIFLAETWQIHLFLPTI